MAGRTATFLFIGALEGYLLTYLRRTVLHYGREPPKMPRLE